MRQHKVKSPYGGKVTVWARDEDQEPRYLEIPVGSTVWVEMGKAGALAAPCEYRRRRPIYRGMVSLEDIGLRAAGGEIG